MKRRKKRKIIPPKLKGKPVSELSIEQKMLRRFLNLHGKAKTKRQVRNVLNALQRAITRKQITKRTANFIPLVEFMQEFLIKLLTRHKSKSDSGAFTVKITPDENLRLLEEATNSVHQFPSVRLILRYITMQQAPIDPERAQRLLSAIERSITRKEITGRDPYKTQVEQIRTRLEKFLKTGTGELTPATAELKGLQGILEDVGYVFDEQAGYELEGQHYIEIEDNDFDTLEGLQGFESEEPYLPLDELEPQNEADVIRLNGAIGHLLGDVEQNECAITIKGDAGSGKSSLLMQIADAFAAEGYKVLVWSLEMAKNTNKFQSLVNRFVDPLNKAFIYVGDHLQNGVKGLANAAASFDVVLVDSFGKADLQPSDLNYLRKKYPNTIWAYIFQLTVAGNARGGMMTEFDGDIVIELKKPDSDFRNNYAEAIKNRFGETGKRYLIESRHIAN